MKDRIAYLEQRLLEETQNAEEASRTAARRDTEIQWLQSVVRDLENPTKLAAIIKAVNKPLNFEQAKYVAQNYDGSLVYSKLPLTFNNGKWSARHIVTVGQFNLKLAVDFATAMITL